MSIIYVFALPSVVDSAYHAFRVTHMLNIALYELSVLHGMAKLTAKPTFTLFVIGPVAVFIADRIYGMRKDFKQLQVRA